MSLDKFENDLHSFCLKYKIEGVLFDQVTDPLFIDKDLTWRLSDSTDSFKDEFLLLFGD